MTSVMLVIIAVMIAVQTLMIVGAIAELQKIITFKGTEFENTDDVWPEVFHDPKPARKRKTTKK